MRTFTEKVRDNAQADYETITSLKDANLKMRKQIEQLTRNLDQAMKLLSGFSKNSPNDDLPTKISKLVSDAKTKTKELNVLYKQWEISRKDAKALKNKIRTITNIDVIENLKIKLSESEHENKLLKDELKSMSKIQKHQGAELDRISSQNEMIKQVKRVNEDNVYYKSLIKELQTKVKRELDDKRHNNERIIMLEAMIMDYKQMIEGKSGQFVKQKEIDEYKDTINRLTVQNTSYKKTIDNLQNIINRTKKRHHKELNALNVEIAELTKERMLLLSKLKT